MNELGKLLKDLRGKQSLRDIAKVTDLSHTYISDLEKGFKHGTKAPINPSPDTLKRLSKAYDYPYEELLKVAGYIEDKVDIEAQKEYDPLSIIKKHLEDKGGAEQFGFFNIDEWKDLTPKQVEDFLEDIDYMFQKAKKRNKED